jgi:hypothetical protein
VAAVAVGAGSKVAALEAANTEVGPKAEVATEVVPREVAPKVATPEGESMVVASEVAAA